MAETTPVVASANADTLKSGDKIARKYMAHMLDETFGETSTPSWVRLGKDLEEYNIELNPDTENKKNIIGEETFVHNGYEVSASADPFYAYVGDPLFERLQRICDERITDSRCYTDSLEVHLWDGDASGGFTAYKQQVAVVPTSYGGDTSGYQIPFDVNYMGERVKGKYVPSTKKFTPEV